MAPPRKQADHSADGVYLGLMSGTSMDGCDGVAVRFAAHAPPVVLAEGFADFDHTLRDALFALQQPGADEIDREAQAANALAARYAACCHALLRSAQLAPDQVRAIGVHGQTVRHRPERGYTRQINSPALLAELTGIDVIADFRARDIAAGGQGAPLAPAFHATVFGAPDETRVVCNLGGISNITILPAEGAQGGAGVRGFDCGPANALLDAWAQRQSASRSTRTGASPRAAGSTRRCSRRCSPSRISTCRRRRARAATCSIRIGSTRACGCSRRSRRPTCRPRWRR